ncbi:MAG TPA: YciI family protein [Candidatus Bathyarchaeia archaeon]|jgi:uncharacterized protein YciI|nr:YciI family protein [Candidatus Bathyarchaeia archaeon]
MIDPATTPQPPGAASIEPVWLVEATYAPDAVQTRVPFRAEHIARLRELKRQGIVVEAGAFADVSASVVLMRAAGEQEALALCRDDVYLRNGVWVELRARAFGRVTEG